jgi:hypothetical protein
MPAGSRMKDQPLEVCLPSGDWPMVLATQWSDCHDPINVRRQAAHLSVNGAPQTYLSVQ